MEKQEKFLWGALVGSAIGVAVALILTPLSGERLREKIVNGLNDPPKPIKRKIPIHSKSHSMAAGEKKRPAAKTEKKTAPKVKPHPRSAH